MSDSCLGSRSLSGSVTDSGGLWRNAGSASLVVVYGYVSHDNDPHEPWCSRKQDCFSITKEFQSKARFVLLGLRGASSHDHEHINYWRVDYLDDLSKGVGGGNEKPLPRDPWRNRKKKRKNNFSLNVVEAVKNDVHLSSAWTPDEEIDM